MNQVTRYTLISGFTWAIDFAGFMALYSFLGIPLALLCSRALAGTFAFLAHKCGTFSSKTPITFRELFGYIGLVAINYVFAVVLIANLPNDTFMNVGIAKIVVEIAIFVLNFFVLRKIFLPKPLSQT